MIQNATNRSFKATSIGQYQVLVSNYICNSKSDSVQILTTSLGDKKFNNIQFSVSPNPNNGQFTVENFDNTADQIYLYNILGNLIVSKPINDQKAEFNNQYSKGIYFIKSNGKHSKLIKIVID